MRALRYYGPGDIRVEHDVQEPECGPLQVKVRPAYVGICGTDLHEYHAQTLIPLSGERHALTQETVPITLGHEFSGVVSEVGSEVPASAGFTVGNKVAVQPTLFCRDCIPCQDGHTNCCVSNGFLGLSGGGGGLSDAICVDYASVFKIPDSVPLRVGALVEPLAVAWHATSESGVQAGDNVIVFGAGPIGLAVIQCLKAQGAGEIIAVEVAQERQSFARKFGATHILDPAGGIDVVAEARRLTGGRGPPVAFDCAGVQASLDAATKAVCARGTVVNLAIWEKPVPFSPNNIVFHEKRYVGSLGYRLSDFDQVIQALAEGRLKPESMITRNISINRVVEDGFMALINEKDKHVKILVDLTGHLE